MKSKAIRAWELIEEDDGSTSLDVEYEDGTRATFTKVELQSFKEELGFGPGIKSIPMTLVVKREP